MATTPQINTAALFNWAMSGGETQRPTQTSSDGRFSPMQSRSHESGAAATSKPATKDAATQINEPTHLTIKLPTHEKVDAVAQQEMNDAIEFMMLLGIAAAASAALIGLILVSPLTALITVIAVTIFTVSCIATDCVLTCAEDCIDTC